MSERGNFRGGRGGRGDRGGARGGRQAGGPERKKENILDLTKYMDKEITVKFNGGREGTSESVTQRIWELIVGSDRKAQGIRSVDELGSG